MIFITARIAAQYVVATKIIKVFKKPLEITEIQIFRLNPPSECFHHPSTCANTSGATMDASDSIMYFGVSMPSFPQVIFSFGTAPE